MKPSLTCTEQVALMAGRGLAIDDERECERFLRANNYYRFSGYARYFQKAPHDGDDSFVPGADFAAIREIYLGDERLRNILVRQLGRAEILLRTHVARVIADRHGPAGQFLDESFYVEVGSGETTVAACLRDIERSKERHILHFKNGDGSPSDFGQLPIWSAVEAWSFGTLSKCIERGASGELADEVAESVGAAKAGFAYRVRALVYLRNRCAHQSRLWQHSVVDAGPTPNNVRGRAKRIAGQFGPRSVLDVVASLDDIVVKADAGEAVLPGLVAELSSVVGFWDGLMDPKNPRDHT